MSDLDFLMDLIDTQLNRIGMKGSDISIQDASEIFKLDKMLMENGIPHELIEWKDRDGWQITYAFDGNWVLRKSGCGDVVINRASYGHENGLLEAMGFDITEEEYGDEVVGHLTAEQAFEFFKRQYEKDQKEKK